MAGEDLVRPSRDGDQFHYYWAARRCLELLPGRSNLAAVTIEGPSISEATASLPDEAGDELIDVGFYYDAEDIGAARLIHYVQLKHSTRRTTEAWTASGLAHTLEGFAARYAARVAKFGAADVAARFRFAFTSNRPIDARLQQALEDLASGRTARHVALEELLIRYTKLDDLTAKAFFRIFEAQGEAPDLWAQRNLLSEDLGGYLPDADADAPLWLKELVTRKATTEFERDPSIRRYDVFRALKVSEDSYLPAPCQIGDPSGTQRREQEGDLLSTLLSASTPVVLHADGGVGKSVMAARLAAAMPQGSEAVLYDCYGDGLYRMSLDFRHRHRDALVQIANELAARGLCHPLIPSGHADPKLYMRAFVHRLRQAIDLLRARTPDASLCILVDAADNAEMAAEEQREPASFVRDLIRTPLPEGVRLLFTCRTHRIDRLNAPPDAYCVKLQPFSLAESALHLRGRYPSATDDEVREFAVLSSANPRVQALALDQDLPIEAVLKGLGPEPTTVDRAIGELLERAVARLRDRVGPVEARQIDEICRGLAVLRPLVPIPVLAKLAQVPQGAVRSFAYDLGRPLLAKGDSLHFLDEPSETWFRDRFTPDAAGLSAFLDRLSPLAATSSYVASVLPQLLLQSGRLDELIDLALTSGALPETSPLARRDVEVQRLTFALKACLEGARYLPAAKLALKAAGETAGEQRQNSLIRANTDLAAALLASDRIEEIVSRRTFGDTWVGSHHAYDAGLLSGRPALAAEATSRLRMAMAWLQSWARLPVEKRREQGVDDEDRAEVALAMLRLRSAAAAARFLRGWTRRQVAFDSGRRLARRLADLGAFDDLDRLAVAARNDVWLLLAVVDEARAVGHDVPAGPAARLLRLLADRRVLLTYGDPDWNRQWGLLEAVTSAIEVALRRLPHDRATWASVLVRYLPAEPPSGLADRWGYERPPLLRAYALQAALKGEALEVSQVAPKDVRAELERKAHSRSSEAETFLHEVAPLLPWFKLRAERLCGAAPGSLDAQVEAAKKAAEAARRHTYREGAEWAQQMALQWLGVLADAGAGEGEALAALRAWIVEKGPKIWADTLTALCRHAARSRGLRAAALDWAASAHKLLVPVREDAETRCESHVRLARAVYAVSPEEAGAFFDYAVEIASRIGDENVDRWSALLTLAEAAAEPGRPRPRLAYRLSRAGELTYDHVARDKHFDWNRTVKALTDLCPASALAILSRWRDRRFGNRQRLLPAAVERLVETGRLPTQTSIALAGLEVWWERREDLAKFLASEPDPARRQLAAAIGYRYLRLLPHKPEDWLALQRLARDFDLELPDIDRLVALNPPVEEKAEVEHPGFARRKRHEEAPPRRPDWNAVFDGIDFASPEALRAAYRALRTYDPPYEYGVFFREAAARTPPGGEAALLRAIAAWPDFGVFELRSVLDGIPQGWRERLAARSALKEVVLSACRRTPWRVFRRGWYQIIPFEALEADGVLTDDEVVTATLEGFAAELEGLGAGELFQLADAVTARLSPAEAEAALEYGLDLLDPLLTSEDGDGPWRAELAPADDVVAALAGYLWVGLGSPVAAERWEHAHAIRGILELGWTELFEAVLAWAQRGDATPFAASGLSFYRWHATQWLLIGLARGATEAPIMAEAARPLLEALVAGKHVVIRHFAAEALIALARGALTPSAPELAQVNQSRLDSVVFEGWSGLLETDEEEDPRELDEDEKYLFAMDIGPSWFGPIARAFGLSQKAFEMRVRQVMRADLEWRGEGRLADARQKRGLYRDGETYHRDSDLPKTDDLVAYHAYHGMMIAAGQLLAERPVRRRAEADRDEFAEWFEDRTLTRPDGRWLFDRRDPRLLPPEKSPAYGDDVWPWAITADDLERRLSDDRGRQVLWAYWTSGEDRAHETVWVHSALVSASRAASLVVALQTAAEPRRFGLPRGDEDRDDRDPADLVGWVEDHTREVRLDESDPWAEAVRFPGPRLSEVVAAQLNAEALDPDGRAWRVGREGRLWSEVWTRTEGSPGEESTTSGWRLTANREALAAVAEAAPDKRLIVSVEVRRRPPRSSRNDVFEPYPWPYIRYFLVDPDGETRSL